MFKPYKLYWTPSKQALPIFCLVVLVLGCGYGLAWLSIRQYQGFNFAGFDTGNMGQAIWSAGWGQPLVFTTEGVAWSRLALHVEVIYFLLVPLYQLFPTPMTLFVVQSGLYAGGAVAVYQLGVRWFGDVPTLSRSQISWLGVACAGIYLFYPVTQTAVLFQFHADTLAMPLMLWAIESLERRAWRAYGFWLGLALACKFYVAIPVVAMGGMLWLVGKRKVGFYTILGGLLWGAIAFFVVRPLFASPDLIQTTATSGNYLSYYFGQLTLWQTTWLTRLANGLVVMMPALLLIWRTPHWLIPFVAITLPTLLSNGPGPSYDFRYHHYALSVPFLVAGMVEGASRLHPKRPGYTGLSLGLTGLLWWLFVPTPFNPTTNGDFYTISARDEMKERWLEQVPASVPLMADDGLGSRLIHRPIFFRTHPQFAQPDQLLPQVDEVILDGLQDFVVTDGQTVWQGGLQKGFETIQLVWQQPNFYLADSLDGLLRFRRGNGASMAEMTEVSQASPSILVTLGGQLRLHQVTISPLAQSQRYELVYQWSIAGTLPPEPAWFVVTRLEGVEHNRLLHLPLLGSWKQLANGTMVQERLEWQLPEGVSAGTYPLWVGLYNAHHPNAYTTDARSRLGDEFFIGELEVKN